MKENTTTKKKKLYFIVLGICVLLLAAAAVLTTYFVINGQNNVIKTPEEQVQPNNPENPDDSKKPDDSKDPTKPDDTKDPTKPDEPDKPSSGDDTVQFVNPVETMTITEGFDFYHNKTLNWYYEHTGVDVSATAGTEVYAMADGTVEKISTDAVAGTEILVDHGDGLKTLYRFVTVESGLKAGDKVTKGQKIATVAAATGDEYKDGDHLHFETFLNGKNVDPTTYLTLEEK